MNNYVRCKCGHMMSSSEDMCESSIAAIAQKDGSYIEATMWLCRICDMVSYVTEKGVTIGQEPHSKMGFLKFPGKRQPSRKSNKVIPLTKTGREPSKPVKKYRVERY